MFALEHLQSEHRILLFMKSLLYICTIVLDTLLFYFKNLSKPQHKIEETK